MYGGRESVRREGGRHRDDDVEEGDAHHQEVAHEEDLRAPHLPSVNHHDD